MGVYRLNHAVLYVRDVARSVEFYGATLGFRPIEGMDGLTGAAFLRAPGSTNDHDLGLFQIGSAASDSPAGRTQRRALSPGVGGRHARRARADRQVLSERGALVGATDHATTKALYGKDPDGLEFEVCWLVPADLLTDDIRNARARLAPLDLAADKARFGADTRGGVGVSVPA